jgi:tRNA (guanine37-N1)-methyltransferase
VARADEVARPREPRSVPKIKGEGVGLRIEIVTIFPGYFESPLGVSLIGKAAARGDIEFRVHDLRRWATDVHHTVDDVQFGGGPGMVMTPDVWGDALDEIVPPEAGRTARLIVPTPSGVPFTQDIAARYAAEPRLIFACGRYEGIDGRVVQEMRTRMPVDEVSIGDYVLAGGEVAVLVMLEAVGRLRPGVLGNAYSAQDDSFGGPADEAGAMRGLLEGPVYTRPRAWRDREVPEVLLSGNHAAIARWRRDMALRRTAAHRADLIGTLRDLDRHDRQVLAEAGYARAENPEAPGVPRDGSAASAASGARFPAGEVSPSSAGFPVSGEDMAH